MRNKHLLRRVTAAHGVCNPRSAVVTGLAAAREFAEQIGAAVVVKPADRQGSIGVVIVRDLADLEAGWQSSQVRDEGILVADKPPEPMTLIEEYVPGPEVSVEALVRDGVMLFANVTLKELFAGDAPVEAAHLVPAPIGQAAHQALMQQTDQVITSTGFRTGIVHCEWKLPGGQPVLIECAGRFAGDGIIELIRLAYGFDIAAAYYAMMQGKPLGELPTSAVGGAAVRFLAGRDGTLSAAWAEPGIDQLVGVRHWSLDVEAGDVTREVTCSWDRLGEVSVSADSAAEADSIARKALDMLRLEYVDD